MSGARFEAGDGANILPMSCGAECGLEAEDPTVVKWADGVVSWMAEEDVGV